MAALGRDLEGIRVELGSSDVIVFKKRWETDVIARVM